MNPVITGMPSLVICKQVSMISASVFMHVIDQLQETYFQITSNKTVHLHYREKQNSWILAEKKVKTVSYRFVSLSVSINVDNIL